MVLFLYYFKRTFWKTCQLNNRDKTNQRPCPFAYDDNIAIVGIAIKPTGEFFKTLKQLSKMVLMVYEDETKMMLATVTKEWQASHRRIVISGQQKNLLYLESVIGQKNDVISKISKSLTQMLLQAR